MAEYRVVEVTQLDDLGDLQEGKTEIQEFETTLNQFCSLGWDIVSTKLLCTDDGAVRKTLVVIAR